MNMNNKSQLNLKPTTVKTAHSKKEARSGARNEKSPTYSRALSFMRNAGKLFHQFESKRDLASLDDSITYIKMAICESEFLTKKGSKRDKK